MTSTRLGAQPCPCEPSHVDQVAEVQQPPVVVLLSTYNGARYVDRQIASILAQSWMNLRLIIRDDGSTDGTWQILEKWQEDPRVLVLRGQNQGASSSFLQLLGTLDGTLEFAAFADQDDVWHPDKIRRAVEALCSVDHHRPSLYCSRSLLTNERLEVVGITPNWLKAPSFGNALVENIATGCTIVLNPSAVAMLKGAAAPLYTVMHDWWCYLVVSAFGTVLFDERPSVLLRQHDRNLVGVAVSTTHRWSNKLARQLRQDSLAMIVDQAASFRAHFGTRPTFTSSHRAIMEKLLFGSAWDRRSLAFDGHIFRQFQFDDLLLRARLLTGPWPALAQSPEEKASGLLPEANLETS